MCGAFLYALYQGRKTRVRGTHYNHVNTQRWTVLNIEVVFLDESVKSGARYIQLSRRCAHVVFVIFDCLKEIIQIDLLCNRCFVALNAIYAEICSRNGVFSHIMSAR